MATTYKSISPVKKSYPPKKPTVTSVAASIVTGTTATTGGNVTSEGTASVTERGVCYGTSSNPTTSGSKVLSGTGTGVFTAEITGLTENTTYYFRAYAKNSVGTSYGSNKSFTTVSESLPIVTTSVISSIANTTAVGGGAVTSIGGSSVTARGICYGISPNPTTSNSIVASGSGIGSFTSDLSSLTANTNYYVRAYATNSAGTAYGAQQTFKTTNVATVESGSYIDSFAGILASPSETTALINFQIAKNFTFSIFYMAALLDDSGNRTLMRALLSSISVDIKKGVNVTQSVNAINLSDAGTPAAYNAGCATDLEKFNMMSQEWEFWHANDYGDFATFKTNDLAIYNYCQANGIQYNIYVARCKDYTGTFTDAEVAEWLVTYHEIIYLVDYVSTAKYNTYNGLSAGIQAQIQLIANAAKAVGKTQKVIILWASQGNIVGGVPTNMATFFEANPTLIPAYNGFKSAYNEWNFTNRTSIQMLGQNIYAYTGIKDL